MTLKVGQLHELLMGPFGLAGAAFVTEPFDDCTPISDATIKTLLFRPRRMPARHVVVVSLAPIPWDEPSSHVEAKFYERNS